MIINALVSVLLVSCVIFLYYYLPASNQTSTFTVEKENTIHITKAINSIANAKMRTSSSRNQQIPLDRSSEEAIDETIYIDNYGDENYDNSGNFANQVGDQPVTAPVTIIERPVERSKPDDDFYYDNYDESETDDEDVVSSGDGKIVVNVKKPLAIAQPEPVNYIENVYSVSSEIVSNLKSQYSIEDAKQVQINKPDRVTSDNESDKDDSSDDEWLETSAKGKRLIGNLRSQELRSRQLLLCETARTGELCRMLFKGTAG